VKALFGAQGQRFLGVRPGDLRFAAQLVQLSGEEERLRHAEGMREFSGPRQCLFHALHRSIRTAQHP
jgi:hypothetical protein